MLGVTQQAVSDWEGGGGVDKEHWPALKEYLGIDVESHSQTVHQHQPANSPASYMIMNWVDIRTIAEIMGHRNISQTMRYTHFLDSHRIEAIQAIGRLGK